MSYPLCSRIIMRRFVLLLFPVALALICSRALAIETAQPISTQLEVRIAPVDGGSDYSMLALEVVAQWQAHLANPIRRPNRLRSLLAIASPVDVHRLVGAEELPITNDPRSINGRLARYVFFDFLGSVDAQRLLNAVASEPGIESAHVSYSFPLTPDPLLGTPWGFDPPESYQRGMHALDLPDSWEWSTGNALVAVLDNGLDVGHPDLAAFDAQGNFVGGNFIPQRVHDYSDGGNNVDENEPYDLSPGCSANFEPPWAGHGTHVTGIIAGTTGNGIGIAGACPHCSLYIAKTFGYTCYFGDEVLRALPENIAAAANGVMDNVGAQVVNLSAGSNQLGECGGSTRTGAASQAYCDMLAKIEARDVIFVASSGNDRNYLDFPARDSRVVSAGGINTQFELWDEAPNQVCDYPPDPDVDTCNCPRGDVDTECGSNFTTSEHPSWRQELVAPAKSVLSTFYRNEIWHPDICRDDIASTTYDDLVGYGFCTGTSMAAPHISGLFGVLRSLNPLLHAGDPDVQSADSLRYIVASTTFENFGNPTPVWDPKMGYGRPDAYQAVRKILGTIGGVQAKNRITPLFGVYGTNALDSAYSTAPQAMVAFSQNGTSGYDLAIGSPIPGYATFPHESGIPVFTPKAPMYIFSSHQPPVWEGPELLPLYRMARSQAFPVGCTPGTSGCNGANRDFTYAVSASEIEDYHDDGFGLEKLEGYIFEPCNGSITVCPVPGTEKLYRMYNPTTDDTALVLEPERAGYVSDGYSFDEVIGSAYPSGDNDAGVGDGFIDGYELTVGLDPDSIDTDCDGLSDGAEWPLASIAMSSGAPASRDPLNGTCTYPVSVKTAAETNPTGLKVRNAGGNDASGVVVTITVGSVSMNLNVSILGGPSCVPTPIIGGGGYIGSQSRWTCAVGDLDATDTASWSIQTSCGATQGPTPSVAATIDVMHVDQPDVDPTDNRTESVFFCGDPV